MMSDELTARSHASIANVVLDERCPVKDITVMTILSRIYLQLKSTGQSGKRPI